MEMTTVFWIIAYGLLVIVFIVLFSRPLIRRFIRQKGKSTVGHIVSMETEQGLFVERGQLHREALVITIQYTTDDGKIIVGRAYEIEVHLHMALIRTGHDVAIRYHPLFPKTLIVDATSFKESLARNQIKA